MRPSELTQLLWHSLIHGMNICILGEPGVGKTSMMKSVIAKAMEQSLITGSVFFHNAFEKPINYMGLGAFDEHGNAFFSPYGRMKQVIESNGKFIVCLDDLLHGGDAVQQAAMQFVRGIAGDKAVPENVIFWGATNGTKDKAHVKGMIEPFKTSWHSLPVVESHFPDWKLWAQQNDATKYGPIFRDVIDYLDCNPGMLRIFKPTMDLVSSPCERTWEHISDWLHTGLPENLWHDTFEGSIGPEAAISFMGFMEIRKSLIQPNQVLSDPTSFEMPHDPGTIHNLLLLVAPMVNLQNIEKAMMFCNRLPGEFQALFVKTITDNDKRLENIGPINAWRAKNTQTQIRI